MPKVSLSAEFVRTVPIPDRGKKDYYDASITGFILECRATGGKTYAIRYRDSHGRQRQHKVGDAQSISFEKARATSEVLRSRIVLGGDPAQERQTKRSVPTLAELTTRYLNYVRTVKRSSHIDESQLRNHILPQFGKIHIDEIQQADLVAWMGSKRKDGYAAATINRILIILRYMFRLAQRWEIEGAAKNPMVGIAMLESAGHRERFLSPAETQRLQQAVEQSENPMLKFFVGLALLTGARKRELLDARLEDFDLERRSWRVPMSKNGKHRYVPLSCAAVALIAQIPRLEDCPYLLANPKTRKPYENFFHSWDTARKLAGLADCRVHDLRHSAASNMANAGQSLLTISKVLGHSQIKTTQIYAHISQETLLAAVDAGANSMGTDWAQPQALLSE